MAVHDVAQRGFDSGADAYDRARPSYPADAVEWISSTLRLGAGVRCCDLAAGTGKLTALLLASGADLVAVEPVEGMWRRLRERVPGTPVIAGTAEALPISAAAFDAVTIAQAFHWFDPQRAFAELARTVRPGGRVALIWNARDRSVGWVDALWSIMDRVEKRAPWRDHERWSDSALGDRTGFGTLHEATFHHAQVLDVAGVVDRFASVSHVAVLPEPDRAAVLDEVRSVLARHPDTAGREELAIPYRVDAYWCERDAP
jgi:SAM-dependent methyltransferase